MEYANPVKVRYPRETPKVGFLFQGAKGLSANLVISGQTAALFCWDSVSVLSTSFCLVSYCP